MTPMFDTLRGRVTAWYMAVLAATLIVCEIAVYAMLAATLHERVDASLAASINVTTTSLSNDVEEGQSRAEAARATVDELSSRETAVAVFDTDGRLMAAPVWEDDIAPAMPGDGQVPDLDPRIYDTVEADGDDRVRVAIKRVTVRGDLAPFIIHVSTPLEPVDDELSQIRTVLLTSIPAVVFLAGVGGWFMARKSLKPVVLMAERARQIGATNLDQRLPVANTRDELGRLAGAFNEMLERMSTAFTQQRQFMADASHELRTPLATIRAATGVILKHPERSESEYREALRMIDDQSVRLTRIVEDLFTLARADAGHLSLDRSTFYLEELLADVVKEASVRGAMTHTAVTLSGATDVRCIADEELVRRLVANLVDNAIKHSPPGEPVEVTLEHRSDTAIITVSDHGPGIPEEAQAHVFKRFYRADQARARTRESEGPGAGLGLAIARGIAEAHGGKVFLSRSTQDGTSFVVELPTSPRPSRS